MIPHLDSSKTSPAPRGRPRRRIPRRRLFALGLITGLALIQAGCQSGPLGNCGGCSSTGFLRRTTARVFHTDSGCCGSTGVSSAPVEYGAPSTVVGPATTASPMYSTGPSSGSIPSTVPLDTPPTLDPIPKARSVPLPGSTSTSGSGAVKTSTTMRPYSSRTAARLDAGPTTRPISRSGSGQEAAGPEESRDDDNPLDHLPPLGLPGEVTNAEVTSPAPSAFEPEGKAGEGSTPGSSSRPGPARAEDRTSLSLSKPTDSAPEPDPSPGSGAGTGIARFASVDMKLAGGSMPSAAGLSWLAEKGYRTVLDLRESAEVSPAFMADAASRGLRYVALPINLKSLDADRLARFQFELAAPEARPLFFFDSDGTRAGALWYIRRVTLDHVDPQLARREAEDIGLKDKTSWRAATAYVDRLEAAKAHPAATRTGAADSPATPGAPSEPSHPADHRAQSDANRSDSPRPSDPSVASRASEEAEKATAVARQFPMTDASAGQESVNWRPFAAILLTGLSLPLAYLTRTAVPAAIARARASLPAPAPRRRSLPHESGA
jgi:Putative phosphatase (DUF442)